MFENVVIRLLVCFLIGSIPFAVVSMTGSGIDIRKVGSGNPGFNNVLRVSSRRAVVALVGDMGKGALAVWLVLRNAPPAPFVPEQWHGKKICAMAVCYTGDLAHTDDVVAPIRAIGDPIVDLLAEQPYTQVQSYLDDGEPKGMHYYWKTDYAAELARKRHPLLGNATVSVGTICGGTQPNIVPDHCEISVDRRTLPGETHDGASREIQRLLRRHNLKASCVGDRVAPCFPLETDPTLSLVAQFLRSAGQRHPAGVHYFCDAAVLAAGGIPSIVFGPGDIAQAHTADEWISLASLDRARAMLVRFLSALP